MDLWLLLLIFVVGFLLGNLRVVVWAYFPKPPSAEQQGSSATDEGQRPYFDKAVRDLNPGWYNDDGRMIL